MGLVLHVCACVCMYVRTRMHVRAHIFVYKFAHVHMCLLLCNPSSGSSQLFMILKYYSPYQMRSTHMLTFIT